MTAPSRKSKRGRPPKPGGPTSPAERMRAYRVRRKATGIVVRRFTREERRQWDTFKANAAARKRLKFLIVQAQELEKEYEGLCTENERLGVQVARCA